MQADAHDVVSDVPQLEELLSLHGAAFLRAAYRRLLLREPDHSGMTHYLRCLERGQPKVEILGGMARSKEGRGLAINLPGLARAALLHRLARLPLLGLPFRWLPGIEGDSASEARLRVLDESLHAPGRMGPAQAAVPAEPRAPILSASPEEFRYTRSGAVTSYAIRCLQEPKIVGEMAIFVTHAVDGVLKPHVAHYLAALERQGIGVILVIAVDQPVGSVPAESVAAVHGLFVRENKGYDFAAWAHVLQLYPLLYSVPILYLANDSLFGPFSDQKFGALIGRIRASGADMIGLTESMEYRWHVQSYFMAFKPGALAFMPFHEFINGIRCLAEKDAVIQSYELRLAATLRHNGLTVEVMFHLDVAADPFRDDKTLFQWKQLVGAGFPFVKVATLRGQQADVDVSDWRGLLAREGYDTGIVERTLDPRALPARAMRVQAWRRPPPSIPLRVAIVGPWNLDGGRGYACRGYVSALAYTDFDLNLHPVRAGTHGYAALTPTIDCRSFSADPDLVIVAVDPGDWDAALDREQRAVIARARKVAGAWCWDEATARVNPGAAFRPVDVIWAPSQYSADEFAMKSGLPVRVVPYCIPPDSPCADTARTRALRHEIGVDPGSRVLLHCFEGPGVAGDRNPLALIAAFEVAALAREGWQLVLYADELSAVTAQGSALREMGERAAGVCMAGGPLGAATLHAMLSAADIYVSPHATNGFGLTLARAMAMGKVVVATDFGGSRDFLDLTCGYPVRCVLRRSVGSPRHPAQCRIRAELDTAVLAHALRQSADRVVAGDLSLGRAARERIALRCSPQAVASAIARAAVRAMDL